ncbi:MAG: carboxypeptidase-like regulatory domain-containing protein, partial [Casimicrobium sp.]
QPKVKPETTSIVSKILAVIKFDSAMQSPISLGVRSVGATTRQIIFSADTRDIDLRIAAKSAMPSTKAWTVSGQILGPDENGLIVLTGAGREWTTSIDEMGEFHFDDLPEGDYRLSANFEGAEVTLPGFRIPAH